MNHMSKKLFFVSIFILTSGAFAAEVNVDFDINITSKYADCEPIAERVVELVKKYIRAEDDAIRSHFEKKIKRKKKKLRKCEKDNKKWYKKMAAAVSGGQITVSQNF